MLKIGKKGAIYLPKWVLKELKLNEGDYVAIKVKRGRIILEVIPDPLLLAASSEKWASTTVEEFEEEPIIEQRKAYEDST